MSSKPLLVLGLALFTLPVQAQNGAAFDAARAFGARESVTGLNLSPDGQNVVYVAPGKGQGGVGYVLSVAPGSKPKPFLSASGNPERLVHCFWVSNERLACRVGFLMKDPTLGVQRFGRMIAVNADGSNLQLLSVPQNSHSQGVVAGGDGSIIDRLPSQDNVVLMSRYYRADDHIGSHLGSDKRGLAVDLVDTRNLSSKHVEPPRPNVVEYISDARGNVRVFATVDHEGDMQTGVLTYMYRAPNSADWHKLADYNYMDHSGFEVAAVDSDLDVAYGFKKKDGRLALYSVSLDGSTRENLIFARPDVDVDDLVEIGRQRHVVGVSYATDVRHVEYFEPEIARLLQALHKALPQEPLIYVADTSADESKLLVYAGSDSDPGVYYLFDRKTHQLQTFLVVRNELEGVKLASVKPVTYPAADGTMVPGYLTLPPGKENAKGLPAIVLPHGGPSARDEWGFDWLSQFYAARGFAVLQPEFRGSAGYGDAWFQKNGFRSWPVAIGDVLAAGRWLVKEGIADPSKLAIVGWSYGGYAALQSAVVDPGVFKAVVAIAPVTDLNAFKDERRRWSDYNLIVAMIGEGPHVKEGSPDQHADKIKVPVLLFHGALDRNVDINHSRRMAESLKGSGGNVELVTWENLDHYLEDSDARAQMLSRSDEFLRKALGL
jgi:dipeptidyl aminopeptidase/acylaminoacyl peptidase